MFMLKIILINFLKELAQVCFLNCLEEQERLILSRSTGTQPWKS